MDVFDGEDSENITPLLAANFSHTPQEKRRSWFISTPTRVPLPASNSGTENDLLAADRLELTHFTRPAYLQFDRVRSGSSGKELVLLVENPCDEEQEVEISRFPKRDFLFNAHEFIVPPKDSYLLRITWRPTKEGRIRDSVQFYVNKVYRLCAFMLGEATPQLKSRKQPLNVITNLSNVSSLTESVSESMKDEKLVSTPKSSTSVGVAIDKLFDDQLLSGSVFQDEITAESTFISDGRPYPKARIFRQPQIGHLTVNKTTLLRRKAALESSKSRSPVSKLSSSLSFNRKRSSSVTKLNKSKRRCSLDNDESATVSRRILRPVNNVSCISTSNVSFCSVSSPVSAPNPYASKNTFYDSKWMEKQEWGFIRWLNFTFNPLIEDSGGSDKSFDVPKESEAVSMKAYSDWRQLNRLRREASKLFQSIAFSGVARKIEREVENGRFLVRKDVCFRADKGLQRRVLDLITSFHPLWLRISLETICGDILCTVGADALSRFAHSRILWNTELAREYAHPKVVNFYKPGFDVALNKHILKRFLTLVFFLDTAKFKGLIDCNPCLFKKSSKHKSTKDVLLVFSRDYLSGEGDLSKHLSYLGFTPRHHQSALDEFDFTVRNLAVDLRDGIRLVKLTELLLDVPPSSLMSRVRCPAVSRLQKIHNVEVAVTALHKHGISLLYRGERIDPRDVVDGHREKTLALMLSIMLQVSAQPCVPYVALSREVEGLERKLAALRGQEAVPEWPMDIQEEEENGGYKGTALLLHWVRLVCQIHCQQVCPTNLSRSFCDGRALCLVIHHYQPSLIAFDDIHFRTTQTVFSEVTSPIVPSDFSPNSCRPRDWDSLVRHEKENQKRLMSALNNLGGVPMLLRPGDLSGGGRADDKLVLATLSYICARLLDQNELARAAVTIQGKWRARKQGQHARKEFLILRQSAIRLQRWWRIKLQSLTARRKQLQEERQRREAAATVIQRAVRRRQSRARAVRELEARREQRRVDAAVVIQRFVKGWSARRTVEEWKRRRGEAATILQSHFRGSQCRLKLKRLREEEEKRKQEAAALRIQSWVRGCWSRRKVEEWRGRREGAAVTLQKVVRGRMARKKVAEMKLRRTAAAVAIQKLFRGWVARRQIEDWRRKRVTATIVLQRHWRGWASRRRTKCLRRAREEAAVKVQVWFRSIQTRRRRCEAAVTLQRFVRGWRVRRDVRQKEAAAVCIQRHFRRWLTWKLIRRAERWHTAAEVIQAAFRGWKARRHLQRLHQAARVIQNAVRRRNEHRTAAAVTLQAQIRCWIQRRRFCRLRTAVLHVQLIFMRTLLVRHHAARVIQRAFQRSGLSRWLRRRRQAAIVIQAAWRGKRQRDSLAHDTRVVDVRHRILTQLAEVSEEDKLCNRARSAVDSLLRNQMVTEIMKTIVNLDVVTRLSPTLCEYISESGAVPTLYRLLLACNRSVPHLHIMASVMSVLLNLGRHPPSRASLWTDQCAPTLVELLIITQNSQHGGPGQSLFARAACLLGLLCEDNAERRAFVLNDATLVRRLAALRNRMHRKEHIQRRRTHSPVRNKAAEQKAREVFLMPDWRRRCSGNWTELSPYAAITFIVDIVLRLPSST